MQHHPVTKGKQLSSLITISGGLALAFCNGERCKTVTRSATLFVKDVRQFCPDVLQSVVNSRALTSVDVAGTCWHFVPVSDAVALMERPHIFRFICPCVTS